jgi:hypothetical protein
MRYFRHTIAEHPCSKHWGYCRSAIEANMSPFHLIAAARASVPLGLFSIHQDFPWYYLVSIIPGELLLICFSGFISMFLSAPITILRQVRSCPKCGATLAFAGRHFDPLGSQRPDWSDILILVVFIASNVIVWISLLRSDWRV